MTSTRPRGEPVVEVTGGSVARGGRPILRRVALRVDAGEAVAVLGPNGSGKSTLVRTMLGLDPLTTGSVRWFSEPIARFSDWQRIGFVPQRSTLAAGVPASVGEIVATGRLARRRPFGRLGADDRDAVRRALAATALQDRIRHDVSTLSGGQQQRVLIARTLAGEPDVLLLDEPNAGVDRANQEQIARSVAGRLRAGGTLVVVLHELGPFAPLIDRAVVLREGRIVHDGPPSAHAVAEHTSHAHHHLEGELGAAHLHDVRAPLDGTR